MFYKFFGYVTALLCAFGTVTLPRYLGNLILHLTNENVAIFSYIALTILFACYTGLVITRTIKLTIEEE